MYGGVLRQAINATAPHPYAARLWEEYLYSDQGQIIWLKGGAHPARFADLVARKVIPQSVLASLPAAAIYTKVKFASLGQQTKAKALIASSGRRRSAGSAIATEAAPQALRPDLVSGRRRLPSPGSATLPFFAYTIALPVRAGGLGDRGRVPGQGRQRRSPTSAFSSTIHTSMRTRRASRSASSPRSLGGVFGLLVAYAAIREGRPAGSAPA